MVRCKIFGQFEVDFHVINNDSNGQPFESWIPGEALPILKAHSSIRLGLALQGIQPYNLYIIIYGH